MKLLLTSAGFTNRSIIGALESMAAKPLEQLNLAFIPTAANVEPGDKDWLIDDLVKTKKLGFKEMDIVDISALPADLWRPRLERANILMFGGGNTFHLMYWLEKSGLKDLLPELLQTRVFVGISAGSCAASHDLNESISRSLYDEVIDGYQGIEGLGLVDFQVWPHLNSPFFPKVRASYMEKLAKEVSEPVYALDDNSAIQVVDGAINTVSEGSWLKYNV